MMQSRRVLIFYSRWKIEVEALTILFWKRIGDHQAAGLNCLLALLSLAYVQDSQLLRSTNSIHEHQTNVIFLYIFIDKKFSVNLLISGETTFLLFIPPSTSSPRHGNKTRRGVSCRHELIHHGLLDHFPVDAIWGRLTFFSIWTFQSQFQNRS